MTSAAIPIVPGRSCGSCTLCCKVLGITELEKAPGIWCPKCDIGKGCSIYVDRPAECQTFQCMYLIEARLEEHWRPSKAKMVLSFDGKHLTASLDPGSPGAWRNAPYFAELKRFAVMAAPHNGLVYVKIGMRIIVVLPDAETDLGIVEDSDRILSTLKAKPGGGTRVEVEKVKHDDPRLTGQQPNAPFRPQTP